MPVVMLSERVGYVPGAVNIGVILGAAGRTCALVDTGLNDSSARKALNAIQQDLGATVDTVIATHGHADHFGGNAFVVKRTGASVWAPRIDEAILRYPILLPSLLFAGADPPVSLRGGFLLAAASPVDRVIEETTITYDDASIAVIPIPGHSPGQVGYLVDSVFFSADVVLPENVLQKYRIPYLYSVRDHLASLAESLSVPCSWFVPGHGDPGTAIEAAVQHNRSSIERVCNWIVERTKSPRTAESLFHELLDHTDAPIANEGAYFLLHPTVFAFLSFLEGEGAIQSALDGRTLTWRRS
jgi:glyoxylase-like metal-dependent hydrolase (beta-lactamase superfamily II)